ncbi:MAG: AAA family ATPase [Actinobacteria bacterium]|nr:AAA family ATPase [Actinomycetota bacterium]
MSSVWDEITGHEEIVSHLEVEAAAPSHAYLFAGPSGIGKSRVARALAAAVNCKSLGCGSCPSCLKVAHGVHPDVHILEPAGKSEYLIGQIVKRPTSGGFVVVEEANRTPFEGRRKVFIFEDADRLSEETSNALLKTLEEPPGDALFILIAESITSLLPTITSRCRVVRFFGIPPKKVVDLLVEKGFQREEAELASILSGGVIGEAYSFITSPAKRARREAVISVALRLPSANPADVSFMAEELLAEARRSVDELRERQRVEIERAVELAASPQLASQARKRLEESHRRAVLKEEQRGFEEVIDGLARWYRDALVLSVGGSPELVINIDRLPELEREAKKSAGRLMACTDALFQVRKLAAFNVNMQMALEAVLFRLQEELA